MIIACTCLCLCTMIFSVISVWAEILSRCNSENIFEMFTPPYSLATICLCQNIPPGIFWHKQIIAKLDCGYSLAMTFVAKLDYGYVSTTNFVCQNIPQVYLCVVEYVCLLHWHFLQVEEEMHCWATHWYNFVHLWLVVVGHWLGPVSCF